MKVLVTGALGFIGYHLTKKLLENNFEVVGIDNINDYYNTKQKTDKLPRLGIYADNLSDNVVYKSQSFKEFSFVKADVVDRDEIEALFESEKFDIVVNLAAQAGVQYSIKNPHSYVQNNLVGFINLIDAAKANNSKHFIYASSSSVYGNRDDVPFRETDNVDNPISIYAATKKANELIAHIYSHLFNLKTTGLRFFTVYGPWGRPDMAPFIFTKKIIDGEPITVFNNGDLSRDFTYINDIVNGIFLVLSKDNVERTNYEIYNIGNSSPINLNDFISTLENILGKKANIIFEKLREGDVIKTYSDTNMLRVVYGYEPNTTLQKGLSEFVNWYKSYFKIS